MHSQISVHNKAKEHVIRYSIQRVTRGLHYAGFLLFWLSFCLDAPVKNETCLTMLGCILKLVSIQNYFCKVLMLMQK